MILCNECFYLRYFKYILMQMLLYFNILNAKLLLEQHFYNVVLVLLLE